MRLTVIFLITVAVRVAFHWYTGYTGDDAYITFRYAENLASGLGFVYNPGQHVLGTTTPLFTVLLALLHVLSTPIPATALVISLLSSGMTSVVVYRFAVKLRLGSLAYIPVLAYILWPRSIPVDTSGMETALFTLLVVSAFYYQFRRRDIHALVLACLAALTRPEGLAAVAILTIYNLYHHRARVLRYAFVVGGVLIPWYAFATIYFGSPINNSIVSKATHFPQAVNFTIWDTLVYLMGWHTPLGWAMTAMAILGGYWLVRTRRWGWMEILWILILIAGYAVVRARIFPWYIAPIYPLYLILVAGAFGWAEDRFRSLRTHQSLYVSIVAVAVVAVLLYGNVKSVGYYARVQEAYREVHYKIGLYLHERVEPNEWVAAQDIGYIGYFSKRNILDRDGLVSPEVIAYNRDGRYFDLLADFAPDWAVLAQDSPISTFSTDERFLHTYELAASFAADRFTYDVYHRRAPESKSVAE